MERKEFINRIALGAAGLASLPVALKASNSMRTPPENRVGFNHLPNNEQITMNTVYHKASSRGHANHGWLDSHHSFSFANYHNPERMHFGALRVLNDDVVSGGKGFGTHPHDNMEIVSIPLSGDLEHKDSMGNTALIKEGDVQVMSAGTGIYHSEFNKNKEAEVRFLQIWLFPNAKGVEPRYDQISLEDVKSKNSFYQILSPNADDQGVWVHQNAWFHLGEFDSGSNAKYHWKSSDNGIYVFVLEGRVTVADQVLNKRDGFGLWNVKEADFSFSENSKVLVMEVPMH